MGGFLEDVYRRLPILMQHGAVSAFGLHWYWRRFGPGFGRELSGFLSRASNRPEQWRDYQTRMLRDLLRVAASRIPYYQRAWRGLGLDAGRIATFELEDLVHLPLLGKDPIRDRPEDFCVDGRPPVGATICPTSGSTGTPIRTYWTNEDFRRSLALREARSCHPAGVSFRLPRATFSGRLVAPDADRGGPVYRFNLVERQVYFSAFHLSPRSVVRYLEPLRRHGIVWGTGYAHAWEQLGTMLLEQGIAAPPLRAIITTSEKLTPSGRATIERAFGCRAYQEYGTVEDTVFACEHSDGRLRHSPDSGVLELRRPDGTIVPQGTDGEGETITTGFIRRSQLFIRYRLGDVAAWDVAPDPTGSKMPILREVVGRLEDVVEAPDGRRTVRFHGVFTEIIGVREAQVIQEARDQLRIKVVPSPGYSEDTAREIRQRVHDRLSTAVNVVVETVDEIPRSAAGKFRAVVSLLPRPDRNPGDADRRAD